MNIFRSFYYRAVLPLKDLSLTEKYQLFFAFLASLATLVALCSTLVAVCQLRETHRDLVIAQRPWMGISEPITVSFVSIDAKDPKASYVIKVKNFGASVATHVSVSARPVVRADQIYPARDIVCKEAKSWSNAPSIFPGQGIIEKTGGGIVFPVQEGVADFQNQRIERPDFDQQRHLYVVGCLAYEDQFGESRETRFLYWSGDDVTAIKLPAQLSPFLISESPR